jgi:hypothetical protein
MALSVVGAAAALAPPSAALAGGPSPSRIRSAIRSAERSKQLWATINICNTRHHKREVGIRGQMPSLGFRAKMYMTFEVTYRLGTKGPFKPLPSTKATVLAGQASNKALQVGRTYPFQPSSAWLAGSVTFSWALGKRVLGSTTRETTGHHHHVDFADPPGYSRAVCRIS